MKLLALLVLSGGLADDPFAQMQEEETSPSIQGFFSARIGGWGSGGFEFEAIRADGKRELNGRGLLFAGADIGAVIEDRILLFASYEYAEGGDLQIDVIGLTLGYRMPLEPDEEILPNRFAIYAGAIFGAIEVQQDNFGRVADDWGFRAGIAPGWDLGGGWNLDVYIELRVIDFEYRSEILDGDRKIGGGGAAGGLSLALRF